jgi:hypothetical protein
MRRPAGAAFELTLLEALQEAPQGDTEGFFKKGKQTTEKNMF